ncbi:HCLS1-binding protein 3 isoform X2 [Octopus bimaculoides]|uniref:HCLS1-binding protein 3 isoform X2 n=1 Tax=Octopus bimaculoides TaxID=37653 RepID=UPI0022E30E83|nr:HCLS1-binding protein 3 isoform X2 [Octopus bimaculoides]
MLAATVTVRQLKNPETGIDVSVPTYEEIPGLLTKSVEYQVTVVTNLAIFKSPKHKESDIVQFVVGKKFNEFEDLHTSLNDKYSGIAFPPFPKKVLLTTDDVYKERRSALDKLMKFCSKTERLSKSYLFLQFLGAPPSKLQKMESLVIREDAEDDGECAPTENNKKFVKSPMDDVNIFGEEEEEPQELFSDIGTNQKKSDSNLFVGDSKAKSYKVKMFEEENLEEESVKSILSPVTEEKTLSPENKSNLFSDDLLQVEDDLSQLLAVNKKPRKPVPTPRTHKPKKAADAAQIAKQPSPVLPTSVDEFAKYIEENTDREEITQLCA